MNPETIFTLQGIGNTPLGQTLYKAVGTMLSTPILPPAESIDSLKLDPEMIIRLM